MSHGVSRRTFLDSCRRRTALIGLAPAMVPGAVKTLVTQPRAPVIWLHGLECTCCSEPLPRASHPIVSDHKPVIDVPGCSLIADVMAGVKKRGDEVARKGWRQFKTGCRGAVTHNRRAETKWNGGTSWTVDSGHPRIGCAEEGFWDNGPLYRQLAGLRDAGRREHGERKLIHAGER